MLTEIRRIVDEVVELTETPPPALLGEDAPALSTAVLDQPNVPPFYLIGLIGGKNVGKSSLVNALVGSEITARCAHGAGTEKAIAYAHEEQAEALRRLLDREISGAYEIVTHVTPGLSRQVLLDLPDIDSHYTFHAEITRRMLRHMLYPIWIQSVEKYADNKPRELLLRIVEGNAPQNLLFCLNKIDQVIGRDGVEAARELRDECASRLGTALGIEEPRVWMISALHPDRGELPALRKLLTQEKPQETVEQSRELAARQTATTLLAWLGGQRLDQRLAVLERLEAAALEKALERLGGPLIERMAGDLVDDPAFRSALTEEAMARRMPRWPIVNILHVLLGPAVALLRRRLSLSSAPGADAVDTLLRQHLDAKGESASTLVRSTFAQLQQTNPLISRLYREKRLWEENEANDAAAELHKGLAETIERQRDVLGRRIARGCGVVGTLARVVLTLGAIVWFPFVQPALEAHLHEGGFKDYALVAVRMLGASYLLKSIAFLAVYFVCLWLTLKWDTARRVDRAMERWRTGLNLDPSLSLAGQVLEWLQHLLAPVHEVRNRMERLVQKVNGLREQLNAGDIPLGPAKA